MANMLLRLKRDANGKVDYTLPREYVDAVPWSTHVTKLTMTHSPDCSPDCHCRLLKRLRAEGKA